MDTTLPVLSASLSLSSITHSFSNDEAPLLILTVTSHHHSTITIYSDDLSPGLLRKHGGLKITDLTTGMEVKQSKRTRCVFEPPSKVDVVLDEDMFHELRPEEPVSIDTPFSRTRKPLPRGAPGFDDVVDARGGFASGVDGLEPGHRYMIQLSDASRVHWRTVRWWEYGTKDEVLRPDANGHGLDARRVKFKRGPHEPLQLDVTSFVPITFECTD